MTSINSNMTRITGMASGLDIDSLVKTALKPYQTKVDQKTQQKEVTEIKQKLYRDLLADSKNFYNKYFDILGKDNLISSSNYKSVKYAPSSDAVSIVASSESQQDNYSVTVNSLATAASAVISGSPVANDKITVNGKEFTLAGTNQTEIAKDLTAQLAKAGIKVEARYTNFAGTASNVSGLVLESTILGKNGTFTVGTKYDPVTIQSSTLGKDATTTVTGIKSSDVIAANSISVDYDGDGTMDLNGESLGLVGSETTDQVIAAINSKIDTTKVKATNAGDGSITFSTATQGVTNPAFKINIGAATTTAIAGTDATASVSTFNKADLDGKISINGNVVDLTGITGKTGTDLQPYIDKLQEKGLTATDNGGTITFTSVAKGASSAFTVSKDVSLTPKSTTPGTATTSSVSTFNTADLNGKISINGKVTDLNGIATKTEAEINTLLHDAGVTAKINGTEITLTSIATGTSSAFTVSMLSGLTASSTTAGTDANVEIKNLTKGGTYTVTENKNTVTLDGSAFTFNNTTGATPVTITAKKDATELKDKIVKFIADYNTMIEKLNKTVMTKHARGYDPLTADQKKDMSDDEVKLWNGKVEAGQLYRDDDISRISNSMKESMRTLMSSTGLNLEKIGIKPVKDYAGTKNGTFSIPDESALQTAIEENPEDVMDLFTRKAPTKEELAALPDETARIKRKDQTGIFIKLKNTIYSETMQSDSSLAKKVGLEGTGTFTSNTLTKSISDYEKKIKDMQKSLASREQALYTKYANLEKILNQYNAQQSSLTASLGSN